MAKTNKTTKNNKEIIKRPIKVVPLKKHLLELTFEGNEKKIIDLSSLFANNRSHSFFKRYASESKFKSVYIDKFGVLCWGDNEIDLNPNTILQYEI